MPMFQDLEQFKLPLGFRGRPAVVVQLWWLVEALFFRNSPQFAYAFRRWLLRCFGAKIGRRVLLRPTVSVTYPWKLSIGDSSWVGDNVTLYSLGKITVGSNAVISQGTYVCAADHDYASVDFPIRERPIIIEDQTWIAARCFIGPGVIIGAGAVIGACSTVFGDIPAGMVCLGTPARPVKSREHG